MTKFAPLPRTDAAKSPPLAALPGVSILIVDDSAACRAVQAAMSRALGASAETTETAVQAMAASAARRFDLLILDIGLADADGRVLIKALRDTPNGCKAAILCVSGLGGADREAGAIAAGADCFAEKPFPTISAFATAASATLNARNGAPTECSTPDRIAELDEELSPHVRACALGDLARARNRLLKAVADGDMAAARRAAHFISGVAGLIRDRSLDAAARALQGAAGDSGALRSIEAVLELTHAAEGGLGRVAK